MCFEVGLFKFFHLQFVGIFSCFPVCWPYTRCSVLPVSLFSGRSRFFGFLHLRIKAMISAAQVGTCFSNCGVNCASLVHQNIEQGTAKRPYFCLKYYGFPCGPLDCLCSSLAHSGSARRCFCSRERETTMWVSCTSIRHTRTFDFTVKV